MDIQKFINSIKIGVSDNKFDLKIISYFLKDNVSLSIWVCLLERHYNNNNNNIENILKDLSNVIASRPKFFKIINNAISKGYLIKEANRNDRRKFNIHLSKQSIKEFEEWALLLKNL